MDVSVSALTAKQDFRPEIVGSIVQIPRDCVIRSLVFFNAKDDNSPILQFAPS